MRWADTARQLRHCQERREDAEPPPRCRSVAHEGSTVGEHKQKPGPGAVLWPLRLQPHRATVASDTHLKRPGLLLYLMV